MGTFERDLYVPDVLSGTFGRDHRRQPGDSLDDHNLRKRVCDAVMEQGSKIPWLAGTRCHPHGIRNPREGDKGAFPQDKDRACLGVLAPQKLKPFF